LLHLYPKFAISPSRPDPKLLTSSNSAFHSAMTETCAKPNNDR
jgi:hypothetical protein